MSSEEATEQVKNLSLKDNKGEAKAAKPNKKSKQQSLYLEPQPGFIDDRIQLFEDLKKKYDEKVASMPRVPLNIVL